MSATLTRRHENQVRSSRFSGVKKRSSVYYERIFSNGMMKIRCTAKLQFRGCQRMRETGVSRYIFRGEIP
ncbi:hypothetical protein U27_05089 [Candidatus Vecturithrix granuli]|uniref:Uncharacterized protein n=1 Tax=Vecturithrix granuli TaxID=1499967 RepID=A0A081C0L1_VECG1|nr:hypothetical protein U27_05089 [Candidatus Vecturithrix granuli]